MPQKPMPIPPIPSSIDPEALRLIEEANRAIERVFGLPDHVLDFTKGGRMYGEMYQESKHKEAVKQALEGCRTMPIPAPQPNAAVCHEPTASDLLAQSLSVLRDVKAIMTDIGLRLGGFSQGMEKACVDRAEPVNLVGALHELHSEARRLEELAGSIQRVL